FRIELPGAQNHARHDVGRRSEPADGHPLAFEVFEVDDVVSDDKNMFETVDGHRHEFEIGDAREREIQHRRHVGIGSNDVSAGHRLRQNAAAVEVNGRYALTVL